MAAYVAVDAVGMFAESRQRFNETVGWLSGSQAEVLSHAVLEQRLQVAGRELLRQLLQDHLDLRAIREERLPAVVGDDGVARPYAEPDHQRMLCTVFGQVTVNRIGYRAKHVDSRFPADAVLNLPIGLHSHGLRRLAAIEAAHGSFDQTVAAIERSCGVTVGKRQVEALAADTARDVDAFYATRSGLRCPVGDVLVLTADAKGVVMRPDALREPTRRKAADSTHKMLTRLSRGEKTGRKRMAQVVAVYHVTPVPRTPADVIGVPGQSRDQRTTGPRAVDKWLHASITDDATTVIGAMFDEATRRDPDGKRTWIALVDGNTHQIEAIRGQAKARDRPVTILIDIVHVIEYLSAPRSAWLYPPFSGEGLEEVSLGLMAYLDSKGKGDNRMPANQRPGPGVRDGALGDPRDMAKTRLSKSQLPDGAIRTPTGKTLETGAVPCDRSQRCLTQSSGVRSDVQ